MQAGASPGPHVRIEIEDSGTGIPEAAQPHVFESFFTTKNEGAGTGLGLVTVLDIVKQHQGFITYQTALNKGTTFVVHLPATPDAQPVPTTELEAKTVPAGRGEMILFVDDEPAIGETARRALERHGYKVLLANDGIEALARFVERPGRIQAVVTDCIMPRMDGVTLCRALRAISPLTPLIVSSGGLFGQPGREPSRLLAELKVRHVLHKPHTADLILDALGELLRTPQAVCTGGSAA